MRSFSLAIPQDDRISFDWAVRWAADRGMTEIEVKTMLFLRFTSPEKLPFYALFPVGVYLRIIRPGGLMVYLDSGLTQPWNRGYVAQGSTSMVLALLYDPDKDLTPPVGVLCVLKPDTSSSFPGGLWIAAIGNAGQPNIESV